MRKLLVQGIKLGMDDIEEKGNPSWRFLALGEGLSGQLLGILEKVEDLNEHMLSKMGGKILGYNSWSFPVSLVI